MKIPRHTRRRPRAPRRTIAAAIAILLAALVACGETPTEISPLARALGEVRGMALEVSGLQPLTIEGILYELWAIEDDGNPISLGQFNVDASDQPVDPETGEVIERFVANSNVANVLQVLVTIQLPTSNPARPSGFQILSGALIDGVADLDAPAPAGIEGAAGSFRIFTPTDGPGTNEASGLWSIDVDGNPTLELPDTTVGFVYEAFLIDRNGNLLVMGRFSEPDAADTVNRFSGSMPAPEVPGEDFLANAPEGVVFPLDLTGARVIITLEPRRDDIADPSQLVVLEATLPSVLAGGETIQLVNRTGDFPIGTAVLF